ncbi:hypothetical protein K503DRAFT_783463 [Rhizopogon vinicolor AM-OR11-026]|uniref:Ricin B lectin domain-containing protein n=1 Tax=Rhizopogon vinicolor AM-OR11-026 TaxID=1314800 RepID=A0A1B7MYG6_9AGAM|nr:hypothetical protein K503DRAFT_783463 [Rhizopogon vinicolor AM-OR11-026]
MSIPLPGTHKLRSVKFPNQLFDLQGGTATIGTPVIGYANNSNNQNMLVVDPSNKLVRLINVASGTSADCANIQGLAGEVVVGSPSTALFKIAPNNNLGEYSIQTTDGKLACSLANSTNYTHVTLQNVNSNDTGRGWIFCPI